MQRQPWALYPEVKLPRRQVDHSQHIVPSWRINGALPPVALCPYGVHHMKTFSRYFLFPLCFWSCPIPYVFWLNVFIKILARYGKLKQIDHTNIFHSVNFYVSLGCCLQSCCERSLTLTFFSPPIPPHALCGLRGPPSWAWQECNRLLRLGSP